MRDNGAYGRLAEVYDILNEEVDYSVWADFIESCFGRYMAAKPGIVLDLACGTGRMTFELARRGYDMIGVDGSAEMLNEAMQKRIDANNPLYLMQDMRAFELYGSVGAVVCCLDSINYLTDSEDVLSCFSNVCNYLDRGGIFIFDVSSSYRFEHIFGDNAYVLENEEKGIYCGWQNVYDRENGISDFLLTVFERCGDGSYSRFDEAQREKLYTADQLRVLLEKAGLEFVGKFGDFDFSAPRCDGERVYIVARKP